MIKNILFFTFLSTLLVNKFSIAQSNAPVLLSNPPSNIGEVSIDTNSEYVVFNQFEQGDRDDIGNRLSIEIDGSNAANILRSNIVFSTEVEYSFDNDNGRVISLDTSTGGLISTSLNGQPAISLLAPNNERIIEFSESNDNTQFLVFLTDQGNLYSINSNGDSPAILLSSSVNANEGEFVDFFRVSPDRLNVVFIAQSSTNTSFDQNIFSVPIDGSLAPISIHDVPADISIFDNIFFDENSSRVIYTLTSSDSTQLFSTLIDGSSPAVELSSRLASVFINFKISNDSQTVVFSYEDFSTGLTRLLSIPADGSDTSTIIDEALSIDDFEITNNNERVIYTRLTEARFNGGRREILSSPINGITPPNLLLNKENIEVSPRDFIFSNNSEYVVFRATNNFNSTTELFITRVDGTAPTTNLVSGIPGLFGTRDFVINEQQSKVFFTAFNNNFFVRELLSVDFDGTNLITLSREQDDDVSDFVISPDGNFVIYDSRQGLFSLNLVKENNQLCVPIKAKNDNFVTICL